jgi:hypothetical protein
MTEQRFPPEIINGFPVLFNGRDDHPECPRSVPWAFIEPGRAQALSNHDQTLERLAERGGLCPGKIRCALEGKKLWPHFNNLGTDENKKRNDADAAWLIERLTRTA